MSQRVFCRVLLGLLFIGTDASAQTAQKFSIQASALGVQLTGVNDQDLAFGGGGELQVRFNPSAFSIGLGVQTTRHELENNTFTFQGGFLEPRYVFLAIGDALGLYASARFMTLSATLMVLGAEFTADGSAISGGGGLLIRLGSRLNGDIGVTAGKESYNRERVDGVTVVTRVGLALGLG